MNSNVLVRQIGYEDFNQVKNLPPEDWKFNYKNFLIKHVHKQYFYGIVTLAGSEITGTGNAFNFSSFTMPVDVRKVRTSDLEEIIHMDAKATGEDRSFLIRKFYKDGWVFSAGPVLSGFYLHEFGRGAVIAFDRQAGITLLELKHNVQHSRSAVPEINHDTCKSFEEKGIKETSVCSRMVLWKKIEWIPQNIYSYASGYCG